MSIENNSSRPSPYPWYLETIKGRLPPGSPEVKSLIDEGLVLEDMAIFGLAIHLVVKGRQKEPRQDVELHKFFADFAEILGLDPDKRDDVELIIRELEANADENSEGMTDATLVRLDAQHATRNVNILGVVVSNDVPPHKIHKVRQDEDLLDPTGRSEKDKLIAATPTSGRGSMIVNALTDGRSGRFKYNEVNADVTKHKDSTKRKMASYAILQLKFESQTNGDAVLAA
jgi:hypothetical protein